MDTLSDIKPTSRNLIINLVRDSGVDVSDWKNFKAGPNELRAASNPKYCYEWAFVEAKKTVVLNLWHEELTERNGIIFQTCNFRRIAEEVGRKDIWKKRAQKVDNAIRYAYEGKLPIHVIICDGDMRALDDEASKVSKRLLDPALWSVTEYNYANGECTLTRGVPPSRLIDQFSLQDFENTVAGRRSKTGEVFLRNEEVRKIALLRANGNCEYCSTQGFVTSKGEIFLETHHIIPLSEEGLDIPNNVAALCPNHHREAHFGKCANEIKERLITLRRSEVRQ